MKAPPTRQPVPLLQRRVDSLWGVGPERVAQLARLGIHTVGDLLLHAPSRYEDRRQCLPIAQLTKEQAAVTHGTVVAMGTNRFRKGTQSVFELILSDGSARLHCRWWNLPFMENYFAVGDEVFAYGKLRELKPRCMDHPETEVVVAGEEESVHLHRIAPIYPLTEGLPQRWLRSLIWRTLDRHERDIAEPWPAVAARMIPLLPARSNAIHMLHFPETLEDTEIGRRRLAVDEFIVLQRDIQLRRRRFESLSQALPCRGDNRLIKPFLAALGFPLTGAQSRVLREIRQDFGGAHPMRRLLQGDVGSGKTAVAACSALMVMESGFNVALMAPTEILAAQHFNNFTRWFRPLGLRVELQTGSRKTVEEQPALPAASGAERSALFIGTHALLTSGFELPNLGLVIIDEQHKFGVAQRETLVRKGRYPHLLVMTATPIPRTLGLTLYGDLDLSVIDEAPPGRGRVRTFVRAASRLPKVWEFVRNQLSEGRQAYLVYPRVEDTSGGLTKAVLTEFGRIQTALAPHKVGLLHGRLGAKEKEAIMGEFRENKLQALVATSLIEVGLDVPNATIMVVENADLFGLAQLHQLRGRIGRGAHESYCILISDEQSPESRERLRVLEESSDGFQIAEADLKLRGPGELLGQQQSGLPKLRFGDLRRDFELIKQARELAALTLDVGSPAEISNHENQMPSGAGDSAGPENSPPAGAVSPEGPAYRLREPGAES